MQMRGVKMEYYCNECKKTITEKVFRFSKNKFTIPLCIEHQQTTKETILLYKELKKYNLPIRLEYWDNYKRTDIAIMGKTKILIEVDGIYHNSDYKQAFRDLMRTYYSFEKGNFTLRIPNSLVKSKVAETAKFIAKFFVENTFQQNKR